MMPQSQPRLPEHVAATRIADRQLYFRNHLKTIWYIPFGLWTFIRAVWILCTLTIALHILMVLCRFFGLDMAWMGRFQDVDLADTIIKPVVYARVMVVLLRNMRQLDAQVKRNEETIVREQGDVSNSRIDGWAINIWSLFWGEMRWG
ncbi:hypothetical protein FZEAL_5536 [Fusarium zealandicum]|uniref:Uncharacterized protein n=1 Tax=Fusarium zealandicum TaxID=1053134 RepID=A0A8H4XKR9_9HYPO|nr:hypothetical protein FZEAL_5536 [Fusarium zealandicum]